MTNDGLVLTVIGLSVQTVAIILTGMWRLHRAKDEIIERMESKVVDVESKFEELRGNIHDELANSHKEYRETFNALREKITQVEIWSRDTFVRRESFYQVVDGIKDQLKSLSEKLDAQYERFMERVGRKSLPPS